MRRTVIRVGMVALAAASLAFSSLDPAALLTDQREHLHKVDAEDSILAAAFAVEAGSTVNGLDDVIVDAECDDGTAAGFACDGIDLLSFVPKSSFKARGEFELSDIWGWVDPLTADEYALVGTTQGAVFFRITDPESPEYLGRMPNPGSTARIWHDIKVYGDHAFIVSESYEHGMLVFDLTLLRDLDADAARLLSPTAIYSADMDSHNIAINTDAGYAYLVGSARSVRQGSRRVTTPRDECLGGLHIVDIRDPLNPGFAGCHVLDAYVHDAQCVRYHGPDEEHQGKDLCFGANEDTISVVDVTDPMFTEEIGLTTYLEQAYVHQGWLTEDHRYFLLGDELDENGSILTRTMIFDVQDLENPFLIAVHEGPTVAIDHNMYTHQGLVYQSNYANGLRVLDLDRVGEGVLTEVAWFDTYPEDDDAAFNGTWSNYPYFPSGTIAVTGIGEGLFLLRVDDDVLDEHADD